MRSRENSHRQDTSSPDDQVEGEKSQPTAPPMAISIAGFSTACSKDALVSSAKAAREALSSE